MSKKTKAKAQARATKRAHISAEKDSAPSRSAARSSGTRGGGTRSGVSSNILSLRIAGLVVAVAALAGGVYWSQSLGAEASLPVIIGLLALGLVAGLGLFTAMRPEVVLQRFNAARR